MKKIVVVLLTDVPTVGHAGQIIPVSGGFAKNALFPKHLARIATPKDEILAREKTKEEVARQAEEEGRLNHLAARLESVILKLERPANEHGVLFGSVKAVDIAKALVEKGFSDIPEPMIAMQKPIDRVGSHRVECVLSATRRLSLSVTVQPRVGKT